jgi:hypothetical protein
MKTKTIFCLCMLIGIINIQLSAQLPTVVRTKSFLTAKVWPDQQDIYRKNEKVDSLKNKVIMCDVLHLKHRKLVWENMYVFVEATSDKTDKVFSVKGNDFKHDLKSIPSHFFLIGKRKTTYMGSVKRD